MKYLKLTPIKAILWSLTHPQGNRKLESKSSLGKAAYWGEQHRTILSTLSYKAHTISMSCMGRAVDRLLTDLSIASSGDRAWLTYSLIMSNCLRGGPSSEDVGLEIDIKKMLLRIYWNGKNILLHFNTTQLDQALEFDEPCCSAYKPPRLVKRLKTPITHSLSLTHKYFLEHMTFIVSFLHSLSSLYSNRKVGLSTWHASV